MTPKPQRNLSPKKRCLKDKRRGTNQKKISVLFCCCRRLGVLTTDLIFVRKWRKNRCAAQSEKVIRFQWSSLQQLMGQPERFLLLALKSTSDTEHQRAFQVSARPQSPNHLCCSDSSVCRTEGRGKEGEKRRGEWEENMSIERFFHPFVAGFFSPLCLFHFAPWHRYPSLHLSFQSLSPHPLHLPSPFSALSSSPPLIHTAISP